MLHFEGTMGACPAVMGYLLGRFQLWERGECVVCVCRCKGECV